MRGRLVELVAITALATMMTGVLGAPVLIAPSRRVFGAESVGRHHDPFTVMRQFEGPVRMTAYSQPVTDVPGAMLARVAGGVAAYNWLVLISFPLAAAAAYLLARHVMLSRGAAAVSALAYAFSPFHLAQAAYHPHIAQTQWLPLYLLALWRCLDAATPAAMSLLAGAAIAGTLSNFYGGFIAAVVTPMAGAAYWLLVRRGQPGARRQLGLTIATLTVVVVTGLIYASWTGGLLDHRASYAAPYADLFLYSAKWWSYLVPPVVHPLLGAAARRVWSAAAVDTGLLEQQLALGGSVVALGLIAVVAAAVHRRRSPTLRSVPVLALVAAVALLCSLSPERSIHGVMLMRPSAWLYAVAPMFRAYARFGVVVQLMAVLLAGIGVDWLRRQGTRPAAMLCASLVSLMAFEDFVRPSALWRDVLPTVAHRWIVEQPQPSLALDCAPLTPETASVPWLTRARITMSSPTTDCTEPNLGESLASRGYSYLIVRRETADGRWLLARSVPPGLQPVIGFDAAEVFRVTTPDPGVRTEAMSGFFNREHDASWSWRWMAGDAFWTVSNTQSRPVTATLTIELVSLARARHLQISLDRAPLEPLVVQASRQQYQVGPLVLQPGEHQLRFLDRDGPTVAARVAGNGDPRALSVAVGAWRWLVREDGQS
ncbi:MAG: hypothetical protein ABI051_00510 [Vicinamibacterales bacterium]